MDVSSPARLSALTTFADQIKGQLLAKGNKCRLCLDPPCNCFTRGGTGKMISYSLNPSSKVCSMLGERLLEVAEGENILQTSETNSLMAVLTGLGTLTWPGHEHRCRASRRHGARDACWWGMVRKEIWKEIFLGGSPVELAINYCIRCKLTSKKTTYMKKVLGVCWHWMPPSSQTYFWTHLSVQALMSSSYRQSLRAAISQML